MICDSKCHLCTLPTCIRKEHERANAKRYYERHKTERLAYQKAYNEAHKADRHEQFQKRWANMTEEQKEKERARQREYHRRKKGEEICQNR